MNSTEAQNPWHKLDDVFMHIVWFCSYLCKVCSHVSEVFYWTLSLITLPQTLRLFYISLHSQAPEQQYIVHCMHYGITLWAYFSEPLVKDSHKCLSSTEKPQYYVPGHLTTHYRYVCDTKKCMETLHVKKMADLVTVM